MERLQEDFEILEISSAERRVFSDFVHTEGKILNQDDVRQIMQIFFNALRRLHRTRDNKSASLSVSEAKTRIRELRMTPGYLGGRIPKKESVKITKELSRLHKIVKEKK